MSQNNVSFAFLMYSEDFLNSFIERNMSSKSFSKVPQTFFYLILKVLKRVLTFYRLFYATIANFGTASPFAQMASRSVHTHYGTISRVMEYDITFNRPQT